MRRGEEEEEQSNTMSGEQDVHTCICIGLPNGTQDAAQMMLRLYLKCIREEELYLKKAHMRRAHIRRGEEEEEQSNTMSGDQTDCRQNGR